MKSRLDAVCRWTRLDGRQTAVRSGAEKSRRLDGRLDGPSRRASCVSAFSLIHS